MRPTAVSAVFGVVETWVKLSLTDPPGRSPPTPFLAPPEPGIGFAYKSSVAAEEVLAPTVAAVLLHPGEPGGDQSLCLEHGLKQFPVEHRTPDTPRDLRSYDDGTPGGVDEPRT